MESRADEIATSTAAALIGVSYEMIRRLVKAGAIPSHRRGFTTVSGAVQGYAEFLRADARRAEANASAVRAHQAKAATVASANARRRAGLIDRAEVEIAVRGIASIASARLAALEMGKEITPAMAACLKVEARIAVTDIQASAAKSIAVLRGEEDHDE